jgi:H+/Cl- antiporter ClcA
VRAELRAPLTSLSRYLDGAPYLPKWLILGCLVGVIAGLGAVAFLAALKLGTYLFLHELGGYQIPTPSLEGGLAGSAGFARPWAIPLIVGFGGLLSGVLVFSLAPEAEGHGTDAAIDSVHRRPREVRVLTIVVKVVASAITLGAGGSGGREGPTAQISSGFGSFLARTLNLSHRDGRIAVAIGIGSGIGSIFSAPLGGALLSAELLYRDDIEVEAIIPSFVASVIGYTVFGSIMGFEPLFGFAAGSYNFADPEQLAWFALIGAVAGGVGLLYSQTFYRVMGAFGRVPIPRMVKPAIGGLLVGSLAIAIPQILGTGYGWIQKALGPELTGLPLWVVLALPLAKILATSLSIGSGGSGGIFGPGMVIGAFTGAAVWRLLEPIAPAVPASPAPFVIVGMMACFGAIARAPVAVMIMVAEMTGSLTTLVPALIAVGIAYLIVHQAGDTIYRSQLRSRFDLADNYTSPPEPAPPSFAVADFLTTPRLVFAGQDGVKEAAGKLDAEGLPGAPVTDQVGGFLGIASREQLAEAARADGETSVGQHLLDPAAPTLTETDRLGSALASLLHSRLNWLPVLDQRRRVAGILSVSAVVRGYLRELRTPLRQAARSDPETTLIDVVVQEGSPLVGATLRAAGLPVHTVVTTVGRGSSSVVPGPNTVLRAADRLEVLTEDADIARIEELCRAASGSDGAA